MLTRLLFRLFPTAPIARHRLGVEPLEDRLTPNSRFVVPLPVTADNVTTFHSLGAALSSAGLTAGDVVEVQPFSTPGPITNASLAAVNAANVTLRGAANFAPYELPVVRTADAITTGTAVAGLTFDNLNLQIDHPLTFTANAGIRRSNVVVGVSGANTGISFTNATASLLQGNTITHTGGITGGNVVSVSAGTAAANVITANTFQQTDGSGQSPLLRYSSAKGTVDVISNNTFRGTPNSSSGSQLLTLNGGSDVSELVIVRQNTFQDETAGESAVILNSPGNVRLEENVFALRYITPNPSVAGVVVTGTAVNGATAYLVRNTIATGSLGQAIALQVSDATTFRIGLQQNTFLENFTGVYITATSASAAVNQINLGSLSLEIGFRGLLTYMYRYGYNDFRSFRTAATASSGAVVMNTGGFDTSALTVSAINNLFGVTDPEAVVWDQQDGPTLSNVNASDHVTGDVAFVQNLYTRYLHREVGGVSPNSLSSGVNVWVSAMANGMTQAQVANGIIRSPEALGYVVDDLYRSVLGREADPAGRAHHVNVMATYGWTAEQVRGGLLGSAEYATRYASDAAYVTSLFDTLLDRIPSQADVSAWLALLPSLGRAGVAAGFLNSTEYRSRVVRSLFFDMLKRTNATAPSDSDVASWVNTGLDVLSLRVAFASSAEFYLYG